MKRPLVWIFLALSSLTLPTFAAVQGRGAHHHYFALEADYVYLKRAKGQKRALVKLADNPFVSNCGKKIGKALITTSNLTNDMGFDTGFKAGLKIFYSPYSTWTLFYTGMFSWKGSRNTECFANLRLPGFLGRTTFDYLFASQANAIYRSDFFTVDLTYLRHISPRFIDHFSISWMVGLRYIDIDEKIKLYFTKDAIPLTTGEIQEIIPQTSRYRVKTTDWALGPFFGGSFEYNPYYFLTWGIRGNLGGLVSTGKQKTLMRDNDNTTIVRDFALRTTNFAYFFQFYPFIEYRPVKFFTFRISYEMLYIGRVVLANRQFHLAGLSKKINKNGNVIYHGFFGALQLNF